MNIGGQPRAHLARLDGATGTPDSLDPLIKPDPNNITPTVHTLALQADGKILVGGAFTRLGANGEFERPRFFRLKPDGTLDDFGMSIDATVHSLVIAADGKIIAGGAFSDFNGERHFRIARTSNDTGARQTLSATPSLITWTRGGASPELARVIFEVSTDDTNYTSLGNGTRVGTTSDWELPVSLQQTGNLFVRARGFYQSGQMDGSGSSVESIRNVSPTILLAAGSLRFSAATYTVSETGTSAQITVTRAGGASGAIAVNYATSNNTAQGGTACGAEGVDYINASGTLTWVDGDATSKTFNVSVCNDALAESNETVNLTLSDPTNNATLGTPNPATLTIINVPPSPPITSVLTPAADTWVQGAEAFRETNFGASAEMQVKRTLNPGNGRGRRGFLRFDTAAINGTILTAKLRIYARLSDASLPPTTMIVQKVADTSWNEMTMTWNNQPPTASPTALAQITVTGATGQYYEFDLTTFIQQELAAGQSAVSFRLINQSSTGNSGAFYTVVNSKEASANQPQLVIEK
jgi:hypothetical protein